MSWREARRISSVAFTEVCLQAIFAFRQGSAPLSGSAVGAARLARRRVVQSKVLIAAVLGLVAAGGAGILADAPHIAQHAFFGVAVTVPVLQAGVLTGLLSLDVAFLWWTGLQVLPTFLASGVLTTLEPLPIDDRTLGRVAGLLYLRLFDLPAVVVLIATPLFVGLVLGPAAGLVTIPGVVCAVAFSLALALLTGRAFVRRVQGSRGGGGRTVVRWTYLVLWVLPAFAMFGFSVAAPGFLALLGRTLAAGPSLGRDVLLAAYPFTFAALPPLSTGGAASLQLDTGGIAILFAAAAGYLLLAEWSVAWLMRSVRRVGLAPPVIAAEGPTVHRELVPHGPARAVLTKDLRIASRTPGYAFLVLFPVLDALAIGLFTFVTGPGSNGALALALAAVTTAALLATFFGPAFFAIEVNAYAYGRTLPLTDRSIVLGKVALVAGVYTVAAGLVLGITVLRVFQPTVFLAFIAAEFPAVVAAAMLELGILFRRSRARGLPLVNLYAGAWYAIAVSIPGLVLAGAPLVAFHLLAAWPVATALLVMGLVAVAELSVAAPLALGLGRGRTT
jgi:predicted permease